MAVKMAWSRGRISSSSTRASLWGVDDLDRHAMLTKSCRSTLDLLLGSGLGECLIDWDSVLGC